MSGLSSMGCCDKILIYDEDFDNFNANMWVYDKAAWSNAYCGTSYPLKSYFSGGYSDSESDDILLSNPFDDF